MAKIPDWVISQRRARGECIDCGQPSGHQIVCEACWHARQGTESEA